MQSILSAVAFICEKVFHVELICFVSANFEGWSVFTRQLGWVEEVVYTFLVNLNEGAAKVTFDVVWSAGDF